ncbi:type VI secretion system membrane subunit TssM [Methylomonas sp. SURF-1]|uniref:Type VI secretion system membrane subunit TssM n=1 Tax=Methylomonas aurea TaxID=2952224 RepID=A0ABT1UL40_9GAMM|nr:type VI secretion system membrane subunit TssM [Methylomonas sp. SURF-1]
MERTINFFKRKWVLELIGVLFLALLIWFIGPLVAIAGVAPLESELARGITIGLLVSVWLIYRILAYRFSRQRDQKLMADLAGNDAADSVHGTEAAAEAELDVLNRGFEEALALLKTSGRKQQRGTQFLYEMPWYAIIGAPGSGKTTALINSGLHFPLAERLGKHSVKGVSGTRDCDWWFSDEAVLLDTAGRYTTQDSHKEVDASAWQGFLQLLKKYRPRRPLNGVFVAVSVSDLMQQTEEELRQHAAAVRRRIMELNDRLGVQLPVYVLFTKTDLIAGFNDFFANLTEDERSQVWGETFLRTESANDNSAEHLQQFGRGYDELVERLVQRRLKRMQEERDVQRRAAIFDFPQQMMLFKAVATDFLRATFSTNRYEEPFLLRGVYFSSGTQDGTPIDRIMSVLAANFRLDRQAVPLLSGRGKSYFLTKLLKQVVFPEAELVGTDPRIERRYRLMTLAAYGATFAFVAIAALVWSISFTANKMAIAEVDKQIEAYRASNIVARDARTGFLALLPKLDALQAAADVYRQAGWSTGFGLDQGDKIGSGVDMAYQRLLREGFAVQIVQRLQQRMQGDEGANLDVLYQLLRVYLMFGEPQRLDSKVAQPWIKLDWEQMFATDPETQAKLQTHLDNLLALPLDPVAIDNNFVGAVRNKLSQIPLVNQVYSRFKSEALFDHSRDLIVAAQLAPNGGRVFVAANGKELDSIVVPGVFTAYGYTELFLKKGMSYVKEASEQNWVLGVETGNSLTEIDRLYGDFKRLYLADYQKAWDGVLAGVKFRPQAGTSQLVDTLDLLSRPDSPLKLLLELVEKNTSLSKLSADLAESLSKAAGGIAVPEAATQKLLAVAKQSEQGIDPVKALEAYFEPFNAQVRGAADRPAPIASALASIKNLHDYLMQIGSASNAGGQALSTEAAKAAGGGIDPLQAAKMEFARLPGPIAASLNALTATGGQQIKSGAKNQLNEMLKTAVAIPCKAALSGRYPFAKNTPQDVLLADFGKVFAANGIVDQFFNANLKPFVDIAAVQWQELKSDNALGLAPASIRQFQIAAKIRDAFFPGGGAVPQVQFELKPLALDDRVGTFRLNIEGQELVYRHGPEQLTKFQWPGSNNSAGVRVVFETLDGKQVSRAKDGAWALFRMFDEFNIEPTGLPDRFNLTVQVEGFSARFELHAASVNNPFGISEYQSFRCPEAL